MNHKKELEKIFTQQSLKWSLNVGYQMQTLTHHQAMRLLEVKPMIFHRWLNGKLAAPINKLDLIKRCAYGDLNRPYRRIKYFAQLTMPDVEDIKANFMWKNMIFDRMRMTAKRRFCAKLKRQYFKKIAPTFLM